MNNDLLNLKYLIDAKYETGKTYWTGNTKRQIVIRHDDGSIAIIMPRS